MLIQVRTGWTFLERWPRGPARSFRSARFSASRCGSLPSTRQRDVPGRDVSLRPVGATKVGGDDSSPGVVPHPVRCGPPVATWSGGDEGISTESCRLFARRCGAEGETNHLRALRRSVLLVTPGDPEPAITASVAPAVSRQGVLSAREGRSIRHRLTRVPRNATSRRRRHRDDPSSRRSSRRPPTVEGRGSRHRSHRGWLCCRAVAHPGPLVSRATDSQPFACCTWAPALGSTREMELIVSPGRWRWSRDGRGRRSPQNVPTTASPRSSGVRIGWSLTWGARPDPSNARVFAWSWLQPLAMAPM